MGSCLDPPSVALPIFRKALPAELFQRCRYAALVSGADARRVDAKSFAGHLSDRDPALGAGVDVTGDRLFPGVGLVPLRLLGHDVLAFEVIVRPPGHAGAVVCHCLREKLVAVARQRADIDATGFDRPEAAAACFIAEIGVAICGSDEDALSWLDHFLAGGTVRLCD